MITMPCGCELPPDQLLTPAQAAALLNVPVKTLHRLDVSCLRTAGNHRRYRLDTVVTYRDLRKDQS